MPKRKSKEVPRKSKRCGRVATPAYNSPTATPTPTRQPELDRSDRSGGPTPAGGSAYPHTRCHIDMWSTPGASGAGTFGGSLSKTLLPRQWVRL